MVDITEAKLGESSEDEDYEKDLDVNGFSVNVEQVAADFVKEYKKESTILDSAQASLDDSKMTVKRIETKPGEMIPGSSSIDYQFFRLPADQEKYVTYVNQKNIKVKNTVEQVGNDGNLVLHVFATKTEFKPSSA